MLRGRMERGSRGAVALRTRVIRRHGGGGGCEEKNGILAKLENAARPYWAHPDRIHTRRHALMSRVFPRPAGKLLQIPPQMRPPRPTRVPSFARLPTRCWSHWPTELPIVCDSRMPRTAIVTPRVMAHAQKHVDSPWLSAEPTIDPRAFPPVINVKAQRKYAPAQDSQMRHDSIA